MRVLAIGDIHGCSQALDVLLRAVDPQPDDLIITLGDYVDRGPDSRGVLNRLINLRRIHQVIPLRGNHDQMLLDARRRLEEDEDWLAWGGKETLASYAPPGLPGNLDDIPLEHWEFLELVCVNWYETETHFFVHGNVHPDLPLEEQPRYLLLWEKLGDNPRPHQSGKVMVCGHTSQKSGLPLNLGHAICIDTWVYGQGWLTCLDVTTGKVWQANQRGESRSAHIDDFA
jgi:serine/threonine protein phosphatase 1